MITWNCYWARFSIKFLCVAKRTCNGMYWEIVVMFYVTLYAIYLYVYTYTIERKRRYVSFRMHIIVQCISIFIENTHTHTDIRLVRYRYRVIWNGLTKSTYPYLYNKMLIKLKMELSRRYINQQYWIISLKTYNNITTSRYCDVVCSLYTSVFPICMKRLWCIAWQFLYAYL